MRCPKCGGATEVIEKRGPYRERRCMNRRCRFDFTTCENFLTQDEHHRLRAKTLASRLEVPSCAPARRQRAASAS